MWTPLLGKLNIRELYKHSKSYKLKIEHIMNMTLQNFHLLPLKHLYENIVKTAIMNKHPDHSHENK